MWAKIKKPIKHRRAQIIFALFIAGLIIASLVVFLYLRYEEKNRKIVEIKPVDASIERAKSDSSLSGRRMLISHYEYAGKFSDAYAVAKEIANESNQDDDYVTLLRICSVRDVENKSECIEKSLTHLKPRVGSLSFQQSYSIAADLEAAEYPKEAKLFYEQAYKKYDLQGQSEVIMSKENLLAHIGGL